MKIEELIDVVKKFPDYEVRLEVYAERSCVWSSAALESANFNIYSKDKTICISVHRG